MAAAHVGRLVKRASWSSHITGTLNTGLWHASNVDRTWQIRFNSTASPNGRAHGEHGAATAADNANTPRTYSATATTNRKRTKWTGPQWTDPATSRTTHGTQTVERPNFNTHGYQSSNSLLHKIKTTMVEDLETLRGTKTKAEWKRFVLKRDTWKSTPLHVLVGHSWCPPLYKQYLGILRTIGLEDEDVKDIITTRNKHMKSPLLEVLEKGDVASLKEYTKAVIEAKLHLRDLHGLATERDRRGSMPLHVILNRPFVSADDITQRLHLYLEMAQLSADKLATLIVEPVMQKKHQSLNTVFLDVISAPPNQLGVTDRLELFEVFADAVFEDSCYDSDAMWHQMLLFTSKNGYTPLHIGLKSTCEATVAWLLQKIAKVKLPQEMIDTVLRPKLKQDHTILQVSCWSKQPQTLQLVLDWIDNSSLTSQQKRDLLLQKDKNAQTPFDSLIDSANQELLATFLSSNVVQALPVRDLHEMLSSKSSQGWTALHKVFTQNPEYIAGYIDILGSAGVSKGDIREMLLEKTNNGMNIFHCINSTEAKLEENTVTKVEECVSNLFDQDLFSREDLEAVITGITKDGVTVLHGVTFRSGAAVLDYYLHLLQQLAPKPKVADILLQKNKRGKAVMAELASSVAPSRTYNYKHNTTTNNNNKNNNNNSYNNNNDDNNNDDNDDNNDDNDNNNNKFRNNNNYNNNNYNNNDVDDNDNSNNTNNVNNNYNYNTNYNDDNANNNNNYYNSNYNNNNNYNSNYNNNNNYTNNNYNNNDDDKNNNNDYYYRNNYNNEPVVKFPAARVGMLSSLMVVADDCMQSEVEITTTLNSILQYPECIHKMCIAQAVSPKTIEAFMNLFSRAPRMYPTVKRVLLSDNSISKQFEMTALDAILRAGDEKRFDAFITGAQRVLNPVDFHKLVENETTKRKLRKHMRKLVLQGGNEAVTAFLKFCVDENYVTMDELVDTLGETHFDPTSMIARYVHSANHSDADISAVLNSLVAIGFKPSHFYELLVEKANNRSTILSMLWRGLGRTLELTLEQLQCHLSPQDYRALLVEPCVLPWTIDTPRYKPKYVLPLSMAFQQYAATTDVVQVFVAALQGSGMTKDELLRILKLSDTEGGKLLHKVIRTQDNKNNSLKNYISMLDEKGITQREWVQLLMSRDRKGLTAWHLSLIHLDTTHILMLMEHAKSVLSEKQYKDWILSSGGKSYYKPMLHVASRCITFPPEEAQARNTLALNAVAAAAGSPVGFFAQVCARSKNHLTSLAILRKTGCSPGDVYALLNQVKRIHPRAYQHLVLHDDPELHPTNDESSVYTISYLLDLRDAAIDRHPRAFPSLVVSPNRERYRNYKSKSQSKRAKPRQEYSEF